MNKTEFRAFLDLLMCADPCPPNKKDRKILEDYANLESKRYGYENWIEAYHFLTP